MWSTIRKWRRMASGVGIAFFVATGPGRSSAAPHDDLFPNAAASTPHAAATLDKPSHAPEEPASPLAQAVSGTPDCNACGDELSCGTFENYYLFLNGESWMGTVDDDDTGTNNFGARIGANWGFPLLEAHGIGGQIGLSYAGYNFHGRTGEGGANEEKSIEDHLTLTLGLFRRANLCDPCGSRWTWGAAYDRLYADNIGEEADEIYIGQWRFLLGYALSETDEVGVWTSQGNEHDTLEDFNRNVHTLHQYNAYWRHKWCSGADTRAWLGLAEDPGQFVFGADGRFPLTDCLVATASAQYILPSARGGDRLVGGTEPVNSGYAQEYWNFVVGLAFYPNGNATSHSVVGRRYMPLFDVADNGSFALENTGD